MTAPIVKVMVANKLPATVLAQVFLLVIAGFAVSLYILPTATGTANGILSFHTSNIPCLRCFLFARRLSAYILGHHQYRKSRSGAFAILDADGRELTPPRYDEIVFFAALVAGAPIPVRVAARWGYLNDRGEEIIAPQFEQPGLFYDGIARVKRDGAYSYIDHKGQPAAAPNAARPRIPVEPPPIRLNKPGEYSEGLASFERDGLWGYRNEKGEEVIAPQFNAAGDFHDGLAQVSIRGQPPRYIRRDGTYISAPYGSDGMGIPDGALERIPYRQNKQ